MSKKAFILIRFYYKDSLSLFYTYESETLLHGIVEYQINFKTGEMEASNVNIGFPKQEPLMIPFRRYDGRGRREITKLLRNFAHRHLGELSQFAKTSPYSEDGLELGTVSK